jgi:chromosome segregation ATPase
MKTRIGFIILILMCAALGGSLIYFVKHSAEDQRKSADDNSVLSNQVRQARIDLEQQAQTNTMYKQDLEDQRNAFAKLTNNFAQLSANLSQANANLATTEAALKTTTEEVRKRDEKITQLESKNQDLDKRAADLTADIAKLNAQIEDTRKKLAASEGDKAVLETNLNRLMAERAELERQFNDLRVLRTQVAKLEAELFRQRQLDWLRRGLLSMAQGKGAQRLAQTTARATPVLRPPPTNYDLTVEVTSDGVVRVIPTPTNSPALTNPPPK